MNDAPLTAYEYMLRRASHELTGDPSPEEDAVMEASLAASRAKAAHRETMPEWQQLDVVSGTPVDLAGVWDTIRYTQAMYEYRGAALAAPRLFRTRPAVYPGPTPGAGD